MCPPFMDFMVPSYSTDPAKSEASEKGKENERKTLPTLLLAFFSEQNKKKGITQMYVFQSSHTLFVK